MGFFKSLFGGGAKPPYLPPPVPAAPTAAPSPGDPSVQMAGANQRSAGAALGSTILTGPTGLTKPVTTARKSLLGE